MQGTDYFRINIDKICCLSQMFTHMRLFPGLRQSYLEPCPNFIDLKIRDARGTKHVIMYGKKCVHGQWFSHLKYITSVFSSV